MPYIGNTPALDYISYAVQNFTVTAGTTVYTLDYSVANENDIRLVINNVIQRPGASYAYSATGTTLTLTSATLSTDTMYAVFIGRAVQTVTPPANSITNTMLAPSVITGQTAETSVAGGDLVLIYDDSATALRKMTRTNFVSGLGGLSEADLWTLNGNQTLSAGTDVLVTPFARPTYTTFGYVGTGMTHSSGIFTFPSTGYYQVIFSMFINRNGSTRVEESNIQVSTDSGSSYSTIGQAQLSINQVGSVTYQGTIAESFVDVTNASTFRIRFRVYSDNGATLMGADLTKTQTHATFIKLAET